MAIGLLARREHTHVELRRKLLSKFNQQDLIDKAIGELAKEGLLSDERFTEAYIRMRIRRGYGPLRIHAELKERGISDELIAKYLDMAEEIWHEQIASVRYKRFGRTKPRDFAEQAKQMRFLQYRGFTPEQIRACMKGD